MTDLEFDADMGFRVCNERRAMNEVLLWIVQCEKERRWARLKYSSVYDWLIRGHRYSAGAAHRRIAAANLMAVVPELEAKIANGDVNLTNLAKANTAIAAEEKRTGEPMAIKDKREIAAKMEGKSKPQAERALADALPESKPKKESLKATAPEKSRLSVELSNEHREALERAKELLSHSMPGASWGEIVGRLAKDFVDRKDPLKKKPASPAGPKKLSYQLARRIAIQRAGGACEHLDPQTGGRCGSRFQVESDHIIPRAMGGGDVPANLRCYCRAHNALAAEEAFGAEFMAARRSKPSEPRPKHRPLVDL